MTDAADEAWPSNGGRPRSRRPTRATRASAPRARSPRSPPACKEFGFRQPIVVDEDGVIIAGHTRLLAAQRLGLEQVPVHVAAGLTPEQVKAYRLDGQPLSAGDQLGPRPAAARAQSSWPASSSTSRSPASSPTSWPRFLAEPTEGLTDPDDVPEMPEEPVTRPGDLYLLGEHRLLCGDCTERRRRAAPDGGEEGDPDGHRPALPRRLPGRLPPGERGQRRRRDQGQALGHLHRPRALGRVLRRRSSGRPSTTPSPTTPPSTSGSGSCAPRSSGRAGGRSACCPHQVLIWKKTQERAHLLALHVGLRADDVRLARRAACRRRSRRPTPRRSGRSAARSRMAPPASTRRRSRWRR